MDLQEFERIEESFRQFHAALAPAFGRKQWRERSGDYLRGLLVQAQERGNAENLAEAVEGASPRVLQRFLTEAHWDAPAGLAALQQYLGPRLNHPEAVWAVDDSGFPKQGKKSVGVAHQYCGVLGKVAGCQRPKGTRVFLAPAAAQRVPSGHGTEFEDPKSQVALDEYEVRSWAGWQHHVTMCLLASAFLLTLPQDWGKKAPQLTRPQVYRVVYELWPKKRWSAEELLGWLKETQRRNAAAGRSHAQRRAREQLRRGPSTTPPS